MNLDLSRAPYGVLVNILSQHRHAPYILYGVKYIDIASIVMNLDLMRAPYALYGVKYIDPASIVMNLDLMRARYALYGVKYINIASIVLNLDLMRCMVLNI